MDLSQYKNVWVYAEQRQGVITPVVRELLGEGKRLAGEIGCELCAVLLGGNVSGLEKELIRYGADKVYIAEHPFLKIIPRTAILRLLPMLLNSISLKSCCMAPPILGETWHQGLPQG